jgi:diacylglycerol kinase (ATP)
MARSVIFLANPASGRGRAVLAAEEAAAIVRARGIQARVLAGTSVPDAQAALADLIHEQNPAAVIACGGDGTVHMALQAVAGTSIALGILPVGTGNDNAGALGVPSNPHEAAALIAEFVNHDSAYVVDAGRATAAGESRWFLGVLSSGFDSSVNARANDMSWPSGRARYVAAILGELRVFRAVPYRLTLDAGLPTERIIEKPGMLLAVANGPRYGGGMKVAPEAKMNDGLLDLTFLDELKTSTFLRVFPSVYAGTHVRRPEVHQYQARTVYIEAPQQTAYADGELVRPLPVDVEIVPSALRVLTRPVG